MNKYLSCLFMVLIIAPIINLKCMASEIYAPSDMIIDIDISEEPENGNYIQIYDMVFKNDGTESFEEVSSIVSGSARGLSLSKTKEEDEYAIVDDSTQSIIATAVFADPRFFPNIIENPGIVGLNESDLALYKIRPSSKIKSNTYYPGGISGDSMDINGNNVFGEACKIKLIYGFRNIFRSMKYGVSIVAILITGIFITGVQKIVGFFVTIFCIWLFITIMGAVISSSR